MPIRSEQFEILKQHLAKHYVAHLPPLLQPKSVDLDLKKNVDRSFAAFAIDHICRLDPKKAAEAVVDDFDDHGIDAIFYNSKDKTLHLVQAKLKDTSSFTQPEALAFSQGIRKILNGDYSGFNQNILTRQAEIELAVANCDKIEIVIAHTGDGVTANAAKAMGDLLADKAGGEHRLADCVLDFDSVRTVNALHSVNAVEAVNCKMKLYNFGFAVEPKIAFYGTVALSDLSDLHKKHGKALYQKNIRTWLGHHTQVNEAIYQTLASNPARFQYLNNGVTALCEDIAPKGGRTTEYRDFELKGFSIINGAQTVASTANFVAENPQADLTQAKVMITLIKADSESDFGRDVTRARNTQNDVKEIAFAALDEEQERIRRELQHLDIEYVYRVGESPAGFSPNRIMVSEAIQALALLEFDPRYPVWMKHSLLDFQRTDGEPYKQIFSQSLSSIRLANAVTVYRYIRNQVLASVRGSENEERRAYKHCEFAMAFVFLKQFRNEINGNALIDSHKIGAAAGVQYDNLRQNLWDIMSAIAWPGALSISKNLDRTLDLIRELMTRQYQLQANPTIVHLRAKSVIGQPYQIDLYKFLAANAPQIGNII